MYSSSEDEHGETGIISQGRDIFEGIGRHRDDETMSRTSRAGTAVSFRTQSSFMSRMATNTANLHTAIKDGTVTEQQFYDSVTVLGLTFMGTYLVFGYFAPLIANIIGFAYPAYASVKAIRSRTKDDDTMWLKYWTVFAFLHVGDSIFRNFLAFFPIYYLAKSIFLLSMYIPNGVVNTEEIYENYVEPYVAQWEKRLKDSL